MGEEPRAPRPPLALAALVLVVIALSLRSLRRSEGDAPLLVEVPLNHAREGVTFGLLGSTRVASACFIFHRLYVITRPSMPLHIDLKFYRGSWFTPRTADLLGLRRLATFTVQAWTLLGAYFACAACAMAVFPNLEAAADVLFEANFAVAHLVSAMTTYVLVPLAYRHAKAKAERDGGPIIVVFMRRDGLILHNANVLLIHLDALLSTRRVRADHAGAAVIFGASYVLFAWAWARRVGWVAYPFLDYTLPLRLAVPSHLGLIGLIIAFAHLGAYLTHHLDALPLPLRALAHGALALAVVRFRLPGGGPTLQVSSQR